MHTKKTLADMHAGQQCVLLKIHGHGGLRHRLLELGFIRGEKVRVIKNAPLTDPIEYEVMNNHVSLRRAEAKLIEAIEVDDMISFSEPADKQAYAVATGGDRAEEIRKTNQYILEESHTIRVALVGNPNCGKTSFFNHAAGQQEKVGNYSGVTVESKQGEFHYKGYNIVLTDLPGTYSLTAYTPEERYVRKYLKEQQPDIVLNIVDASNLERNLFLTTQLIDMNLPMMMALNMYDELAKSDAELDIDQFSRLLGFPIIPTISTNGTGIEDILDTLINLFEGKPGLSHHIHIHYGDDIEAAIQDIKASIHSENFAYRYQALKLLESDEVTISELREQGDDVEQVMHVVTNWRNKLEQSEGEQITDILSQSKYSFIRGALKEVFTLGENGINDKAYRLDKWLTNRWLGFPILILFLWIMFEATFNLGAYPQAWIESGIEWLSDTVSQYLPQGILHDMITDGIIAGVGGVIVFLPNILILFFFISLLEDTGYMARAAFIMDRLMHKMGLHGKSFIPYIIGFGCGVPAIMATRTLAGKKDRIITMLTIPFMSCSARLPVYLLFVGAFFSAYQGVILLGIYLTGIVVAILTSILLRKTLFANETDQFVMELPPYRFPTLRNTVIHMWNKAEQYLKKMGTLILGASIIIWALGYFPHNEPTDQKVEQTVEVQAAQSEQSYIGHLGHFIEPVVRPLGYDWKMGVSILTGAAAKEIIVSSMGILYQEGEDAEENSEGLQQKLRTQSGITPVIALSFMIFILLYFPCIAAVTAIAKESGMKWALFSLVFNTAIAWIAAWLVTHIGGMFF